MATVGIDIGSADSYVAYVGKGIVDVVQNELSKRATPSLVGFTDKERLLGDTALSQIKSNMKNTCRNFKHVLGRPLAAADVEKEVFWSTSTLDTAEDGFVGYDVSYKDEPRLFSATQITAMYLTKLKDATEAWCQSKVADAVISVPSYFSDVHRQAVLDAAKIAGISVLRVMNEHTATALAYGIYRSNDFDPEKPTTVAFCSMGHAIFSVSIVQFVKGKLTVVTEKMDKVGGRDMDECLMREFSNQFKKKFGCEPIGNKKACLKLEDAVTKCKKILSANSEAPCNAECLMEDEDFSSTISRADFETMCEPMMARVQKVLDDAKASAGIVVEGVDFIEMVGGASRVPWLKERCSAAFGGKELSTTLNADESVARGCALQAAILSPLYKVRDFTVEDTLPFAINVLWKGSGAVEASAVEAEQDVDEQAEASAESKTVTLFPANSTMNLLKMLTFWRAKPFEVKVQYADPGALLPGTTPELGTFKFEVPPQAEVKKIKVKAKLTIHGTFGVEGAQLVEEEEYEQTIKEKREIPTAPEAEGAVAEEPQKGDGDGDAAMPQQAEDGDDKPDAGEATAEPTSPTPKPDEKKEPEKKYEWVEVVKKKKRTKRTDINVLVEGAPGLRPDMLQKLTDQESAIQAETKEYIDTAEKRNDFESYIFNMRDKVGDYGEYKDFVGAAERTQFMQELEASETWLYDHMDDGKVVFIEKLEDLKKTGAPIVWRVKEAEMREEWIAALQGTLVNYRAAAESPGEKYGHIAPEKLTKVSAECSTLEAWLVEMKAKQEGLPKHQKPVLLCADMEKKNIELAKMADDILKEPKPAPPKPEKKEEEEEEAKEAKKEGEEAMEEPKGADKPAGPENMDVD